MLAFPNCNAVAKRIKNVLEEQEKIRTNLRLDLMEFLQNFEVLHDTITPQRANGNYSFGFERNKNRVEMAIVIEGCTCDGSRSKLVDYIILQEAEFVRSQGYSVVYVYLDKDENVIDSKTIIENGFFCGFNIIFDLAIARS